MKGELVLVDEITFEQEEFSMYPGSGLFTLAIYVDEERTLDKQLKNRSKFDECMEFSRKYREDFEVTDEKEELEIKYIEECFDNLLDEVEFIKIMFEDTNIKEFIHNNPILLTKKIVLSDQININDFEMIEELVRDYSDIMDKIYVCLEGNDAYVSLINCYNTIKEIQKGAEKSISLNLSPMETVMYIYDEVRNRIYKEEKEDESTTKSRDLTEVLFGDKIVCAGFANIFSALLSDIGFDNYIVHLTEKDKEGNVITAHARNVAYIEDPKYNIDGVYYFDATWDSKREENNNSYLSSYRYFAKTKTFMDSESKHIETRMEYYSKDFYDRVERILNSGRYEELKEYLSMIKYMLKLTNNDIDFNMMHIIPMSPLYGCFDKENLLKRLKDAFEKFDKEISAETMVSMLNNVRKIEYYQNPEWYPYNINDLYRAFIISGWKFNDIHMNSKEKLLAAIFGENTRDSNPKLDFIGYSDDNEIRKDIERIRFTKTLSKVLEKRKQN